MTAIITRQRDRNRPSDYGWKSGEYADDAIAKWLTESPAGMPLYDDPGATYLLAEPLTIPNTHEIFRTGGSFIDTEVTGTDIAVTIGATGVPWFGRYPEFYLRRATQSDWSDDGEDIGIVWYNPASEYGFIPGASKFTTALKPIFDDGSYVGGARSLGIQLGEFVNNKYGIWFFADTDAWVSNKRFTGGIFRIDRTLFTTLAAYGVRWSNNFSWVPFNQFVFEGWPVFDLGQVQTAPASKERIAYLIECGAQFMLQYDSYENLGNFLAKITGLSYGNVIEAYGPLIPFEIREVTCDYGDNLIITHVSANEKHESQWQSGDLSPKATISQSGGQDALHVQGLSIRNSGSSSEDIVGVNANGWSVDSEGYIVPGYSGSPTMALGLRINTLDDKKFRISKDAKLSFFQGGRFFIECFDIAGNRLGARFLTGSISAVANSGGFAQFTSSGHSVLVNDILEITGTSQTWYDLESGFFEFTNTSINGSTGEILITAAATHHLKVGDWVEVNFAENLFGRAKWRITSTPSATTFTIPANFPFNHNGFKIGYYRPILYHRVTGVSGSTFTTDRDFIANATGTYKLSRLIRSDSHWVNDEDFEPASSLYGGYGWMPTIDSARDRIILVGDRVARIGIVCHRAAIKALRIDSMSGKPLNITSGNNSNPNLKFGYSAPTEHGPYYTGDRVSQINLTDGTGSQTLEFICTAPGSPGTWRQLAGTLS